MIASHCLQAADQTHFRSTIKSKRRYSLLLTVFVHSHLETPLQTTCLALVPMGLVNGTQSISSLTPVGQNIKFRLGVFDRAFYIIYLPTPTKCGLAIAMIKRAK